MESPGLPRIGQPPDSRRALMVKLCWMMLWMVYLAYPISDLLGDRHGVGGKVAGWVALGAFLACYVTLVVRRQLMGQVAQWRPLVSLLLAGMFVIGIVSCYTLGGDWIALFSYTAIACGLTLPPRHALPGVAAVTGVLVLVGMGCPNPVGDGLAPVAVSAFLGGAAMTGLQSLVRTMQELREARQAVAALAASDERLRMARDLHDLLGHSLSLITLKSELTARFLEQERYAEARSQVADIEQVSRQSLVDVREAIGGYRRPKLAVELAAARTALGAADIVVDADPSVADGHPGLGPDEESALAWALRESATNVVRHSGARNCTVSLAEFPSEDGGRLLRLEVVDDGAGVKRARPGNGLTGLAERLEMADGRLETGPGPRGRGFRLCASVPLRTSASAPTGPETADSVHQ